MTASLFILRAIEMGLSLSDMDLLSMGEITDLMIEKINDSYEYPYVATQADIDRL